METEETGMAVISFHGRFPLQKPRMLVRCIRTCFAKNRVVAEIIIIRPYFGADFLTHSDECRFGKKPEDCSQADRLLMESM